MVYRIFVEKKPGLDLAAQALLSDLRTLLGLSCIRQLRLLNRYDVEGIGEPLFRDAVRNVFSEPQLDRVYEEAEPADAVFAVEYLPGQFDQRADSAAQCIRIIAPESAPVVRTAQVYLLYGDLTDADVAAVKKYVINPVEAREASLEKPDTLAVSYALPDHVDTLEGFCRLDREGLNDFLNRYGLAMDADDVAFCQAYFRREGRDPTITEIRMIDTYWSDHCRHTTFLTTVDGVEFEDPLLEATYRQYLAARESVGRTKPVNLMDIATIAARCLKAQGKLPLLDESEEINACTVRMRMDVDGKWEDWLLLFKNETHNHPTEIEPFGGAATCIGGAIRDPLSGRAYVYGAMRVTGAADPRTPVSETLPGKLPQRKIVTTAAAGYASYGNQIGLATGIVDELYHPGYAAKRMEIGAVIAAAPAANVRRECPAPGDRVILLGGRTGRDGCGGATGSSKSHTAHSLETCGAEVQKGNAPEERKLQRLFRNPIACRMIKRCNDFGAGGVSVAIGELADGLVIELDAVPRKYEGLDGTELAISESQERMAVVVAPEDVNAFLALADTENLEATPVATVTAEPRLVMHWKGNTIVDLSREFLGSNGAEKHIRVAPAAPVAYENPMPADFAEGMRGVAQGLNTCSHRGLAERFDSTIGAGTVLMPFGGKYQLTPAQAMVQKVSVETGHTDTVSLMAWGYNPYVAMNSPYHAAYLAVVESVSKLIAAGADFRQVYLTFQEYFERPGKDPARWGKPLAALLGAFRAQMELGIAAIGGKDSMSGSFEKLDVPPTLVSFAVTTDRVQYILSGEFKCPGDRVVLLRPAYGADGLPQAGSLLALFDQITGLARTGRARAVYTLTSGGVAEALLKMALGNRLGVSLCETLSLETLFGLCYGGFVVEMAYGEVPAGGLLLGEVTEEPVIACGNQSLSLDELSELYEGVLESIFPVQVAADKEKTETFSAPEMPRRAPAVASAHPVVLIPAFPGTNCEYDTAKVLRDAGAEPDIMVLNNLTSAGIAGSIERFADKLKRAQMVFVPGGFSGGDEPDGSGKFITAFFRNPAIREQVEELLERRDGLMCGICNGFQALIKLGLLPYGKILDADASMPTLTFNTIGRHQSRLVRTRIASNRSPWLSNTHVGEIYTVPVSHGEGRFLASEETVRALAANGQIATQYVDFDGEATMDIRYNPNGSAFAVEGITSPDGRVLGKMGHSERIGYGLYRNVPGAYDMKMFEAAVAYFRKRI